MRIITLFTALFWVISSYAQYEIQTSTSLSFTDISSTGTEITLSDDGLVNIITPFNLHLGPQISDVIRISNNGAILFGVVSGSVPALNGDLDSLSPMIAPFWDDFDSQLGGVYYKNEDVYLGSTYLDSKFIVQWDRVHFNGTGNSDIASFEVVFYKYSRSIYFIYNDVDMDGTSWDDGLSATIGIADSYGLSLYSKDTASLTNISGLRFIYKWTEIPDINFENYLEANGMGDGIDSNQTVNTLNIEDVINLDISNKGIQDITGIQDFSALDTFYCEYNSIDSVNLSSNSNLEYLDCSQNNLDYLNVSNNTELKFLKCSSNSLSELDVSNNILLEKLYCSGNLFTELNFDVNNNLSVLNVTNCSYLNFIHIQNGANNLLSGAVDVIYPNFNAGSDPNLSCIYVDNASDATQGINDYQDWMVNNNTHFVETENQCDLFTQVEEISNLSDILIYPNPTKNYFIIDTKYQINEINIYNQLGELILNKTNTKKVDLSKFEKGIYIVKIKTNKSIIVKNIIKQ